MEPIRPLLAILGLALLAALPARTAELSAPEQALLGRIESSAGERRWEEAIGPAEQLVAAVRARTGDRSLELADALERLGTIQFALRDFPAAEATFVDALVIRERSGSPLDRNLEEPLVGLGFALAAMDRHAEAAPILERALLVSQRHKGLFDVSQRNLRQQLGVTLSQLGRGLEAEQQFRSILEAAESAWGEQDPRTAETKDLVADWYAQWGHFDPARRLYREAIATLETRAGPMDVRLVNPLRSLGRSFIRELMFTNAGRAYPTTAMRPLRRTRLPDEGEQAILRTLAIMEANGRASGSAYRTTLIDAGDWYLLTEQRDLALDHYRRALKLPAPTATEAALRGDPLAYPAMLDYELPPVARRYYDRPDERIVERKLVAEFTVTSTGKVLEPRIVESDATERMERETLMALADALYRPRFEGGVPVDTANVRYQQTFRDLKN